MIKQTFPGNNACYKGVRKDIFLCSVVNILFVNLVNNKTNNVHD